MAGMRVRKKEGMAKTEAKMKKKKKRRRMVTASRRRKNSISISTIQPKVRVVVVGAVKRMIRVSVVKQVRIGGLHYFENDEKENICISIPLNSQIFEDSKYLGDDERRAGLSGRLRNAPSKNVDGRHELVCYRREENLRTSG